MCRPMVVVDDLPHIHRQTQVHPACLLRQRLCGHGEWDEIAEAETVTWTRITDPDEAASLLPAWFGSRMIGLRGRFGLGT